MTSKLREFEVPIDDSIDTSPSLIQDTSRHETFTTEDGYCHTYRRFFDPDKMKNRKPQAKIITIHGIQSHGGWYLRSSQYLAKKEFEIIFLDRRGSGLNSKQRGDTPSFRRLLDDLAFLVRMEAQDGVPIFLQTISWGGKLGTGFCYRHPNLLQGLIMLCPGIFAKVSPPFRQRLRIALSRLLKPSRLFPVPLSQASLFTGNRAAQQWISEDQLSIREATARFLSNSVLLDIYLKRAQKKVNIPVLLLLAGKDQIVDNKEVRTYCQEFPNNATEVIEYPESEHTLEFEPTNHPYLNDIQNWIERQLVHRAAARS